MVVVSTEMGVVAFLLFFPASLTLDSSYRLKKKKEDNLSIHNLYYNHILLSWHSQEQWPLNLYDYPFLN